jgi:hypothetical protein
VKTKAERRGLIGIGVVAAVVTEVGLDTIGIVVLVVARVELESGVVAAAAVVDNVEYGDCELYGAIDEKRGLLNGIHRLVLPRYSQSPRRNHHQVEEIAEVEEKEV